MSQKNGAKKLHRPLLAHGTICCENLSRTRPSKAHDSHQLSRLIEHWTTSVAFTKNQKGKVTIDECQCGCDGTTSTALIS